MRPLNTLALLALVAAASLAAAPASATPASPAPAHAAPAPAAPAHRAAAVHPAAPAPAATAPVAVLAVEARSHEDEGAYALAFASLRALRGRTAPDADLELALALDAVRAGSPDTAWALLMGARLSSALADSTDHFRWHPSGPGRERMWLDGRFNGWHWTVARARAELALRLRRFDDAALAARAAVRARPLSGRDHLLLAICAGRAGDSVTARDEAGVAVYLDPLLPEAFYLRGLWAWREGHRAAAREDFRSAIRLDPTFRPPALALVRLELPSARPDSLPSVFQAGARRATMLVSAESPKLEETRASDQIPGLYGGIPTITLPDSVRTRMNQTKPIHLEVSVLVSETGHPVAIDFPYLAPERYPAWIVNQIGQLGLRWRFKPAVRLEHDVPMWINVEVILNP